MAATGKVPAASTLRIRVFSGGAVRSEKKEKNMKEKATTDHGMKSKTPVSGSMKVRQIRAGSEMKLISRIVDLPRSQWLNAAAASNEPQPAAAKTSTDLLSSRKQSARVQPRKTNTKASD